jgi:hypothetical protein
VREYIVTPMGLITQPNKVGQFSEGAMIRADSLRMRDPGELQPFKVNSQYAPGAGLTGQYAHRLFSTGSQLLCWKSPIPATGTFRLDWSTAGATNQAVGVSGSSPVCFPGRITPVLFRGRTLFNEQQGVSVFDYVNPSNATERKFRWAQLPAPYITSATVSTTAIGTVLPTSINPGKAVTLAAILRRKYADGYEVISAPSNFVRVRNYQTSIGNIGVTVFIPLGAQTLDGDIVEIYRSLETDAPTTGLDVDPGVKVYKIQSTTITAATSAVNPPLNATANAIVGDALYTNQYSLQSSKNIPPIARCIGSFKNYAFYANTTTPAQWKAQFPGGLGLLGTVATDAIRANGVGLRRFATGTFTNGNPTITAISAAEMVGVEVGQFLWDGGIRIPAGSATNIFPTDVRIQSFTASTITMTGNAISSGAPAPNFYTADSLELNGINMPFPDVQGLLTGLGFGGATTAYSLITDSTIAYRDAGTVAGCATTFGQGIALQNSRQSANGGVLTIRGTSGQNYLPQIPALTATVTTFSPERHPNYVHWSWEQQPESVPPGNFEPVGIGEIDALVTTRDAMWIWTSDGLWRWTGYGTLPSGIQANWRVDQIDKTIRLAGPTAVCAMGESVFAYTNQGFVRVSDSRGLEYLSRGVIGDLIPGAAWSETQIYSMTADPVLNEVWLNIATPSLNPGERILTIVWNDLYGLFTALNQRVGSDNTTYLTAVEFATHTGVVMLGLSYFGGTGSGIIEWHDPADNTYSAWTADYQAIYGQDPMASKQWSDITAMFDPASAGKVITPRFNEISGGYTNPIVQYPNTKDARVSFGVPQTAPAVAALLSCGVSGAQVTGVTKFRGLATRFTVFNEQQLVR